MRLRRVARGVDPQDALARRVRDDRVGRAGGAAAVAARRVEEGDGEVGDRHVLRDEEVLRRVEGRGAVDAGQVELGARRHLVDDLGDRRAMVGVAVQAGGAFVVLDRRVRDVAARLAVGEAGEAEIDDRHLDPGAVDARGVPRVGAGRDRAFAVGGLCLDVGHLRDVLDGARRGERAQRVGRDARFQDAAAGGAHGGGASAAQRGARAGDVVGEHADAGGVGLDVEPALLGEGAGRGAVAGAERDERGIELRVLVRGAGRRRPDLARGRCRSGNAGQHSKNHCNPASCVHVRDTTGAAGAVARARSSRVAT